MDVSQSTTQQSGSVKPKHIRHLTVGYLAGVTKNRPAHIRIVGRWVEEAGFREGTKVDVEVSEGRIVIRPAPPPYAGMDLSPPCLYVCGRMAMTDHPVSSNTLSDAE
jgi:Toxin SymE, type I toxin-antitoxin system/Antidote-toxin recognition MazE, bacterial antitoxin